MIKSAVTISLVPEARGGPFVFWGDLEGSCRKAADLGFDAVEIFPPGPHALPSRETRQILERHRLKLAAVGSGAGWVKHRLTLTSPDPAVRERAREFIRGLIDAASALDAPVIIGSMQGRCGEESGREEAVAHLAEALHELAGYAERRDVTPLLFEPLNRYETNLVNRLADGAALLERVVGPPMLLLADLFHMNIEEENIASAIRESGWVGHVHLADSNRQAAGSGHSDFQSVGKALRDIGFDGYVSAEALPLPDSDTAARKTIEAFRRYFT